LENAHRHLIGKATAEVTIPAVALSIPPKPVRPRSPSELLERRPDIAAASGSGADNEQIGIAMADYYPNLSLTGSAGMEVRDMQKGVTLAQPFRCGSGAMRKTLFDAGRPPAAWWRNNAKLTTRPWQEYRQTDAGEAAGGRQSGGVRILAGPMPPRYSKRVQSARRARMYTTAHTGRERPGYLTVHHHRRRL